MSCSRWIIALLFLPSLAATAALCAQEPPEEIPSFLQPPPIERLKQGLLPLSTQLPDTDVRTGLLPPDASRGLFSDRLEEGDRGGAWAPVEYHWLPSGIRYRPTYFEDTMLERHGQTRHCVTQPLASGARFFGSIAALPYKAMLDPPWQPRSSLGHFRPGSSVPCLLQRPPLQLDAGMLEAGLVVGLIFIVP